MEQAFCVQQLMLKLQLHEHHFLLLIKSLKENDATEIKVICGGVIPPQDYDFLHELGVSKVFGPGTNIQEAAIDIINLM